MEDESEVEIRCRTCYWGGPVNEDGCLECHFAPPDVWVLSDDERVQTRPLVAPGDWCAQHRERA